jgi:hypothetical protein
MDPCIQIPKSRVSPTLKIPADCPESTIALIRLPVPVPQISALCKAFPGKDVVMHQSGEWIVISRRKGGRP